MNPLVSSRDAAFDPVRLLNAEQESRTFLRLRIRMALTTLHTMLHTARLRLTLVVILSCFFWGALYGLFSEAFTFLDSLRTDIVSLLLNTFFSSLMVMLMFSSGIILYSSLYCSREARLLVTLPARAEMIVSHMFQEAIWFSSWGFMLLGSPMLVAYGVVTGSPWTYYAMLPPFMLSFVFIPSMLGNIACLMLVAWLPKIRLHAVSTIFVLACAGGLWLGWSTMSATTSDRLSSAWFEEMFGRLSITEQRILPSWWLSTGLLEVARPAQTQSELLASLGEAAKFLALLVANGLFLQLITGWTASHLYRLGYSQLACEQPLRGRRRPMGWFDQFISMSGTATGRPIRLLLVKDLRLFRRDVTQWSQFAIFFGLLALYFANVRSFSYNATYSSMIGFLNVAVIGLILSTFTTRFIYPMISLEGRRFWILGLLPVNRDQIVWSKFIFSSVGSLVPCTLLVLLSDLTLGIPPMFIAIHETCCVILCFGLSGIAVGLGARMPDLRESSPSKIAAGFGGTLSLVISALFIMLVVIIAAVPSHLFTATQASQSPLVVRGVLGWAGSGTGIVCSMVVVVAIGLFATLWPMILGLKAFRTLEP